MVGNVSEWCWDWHGSYSSGSQSDPRGPTSGSYRVDRGASWGNYAVFCRVASRSGCWPDGEGDDIGFRSLPPGQ